MDLIAGIVVAGVAGLFAIMAFAPVVSGQTAIRHDRPVNMTVVAIDETRDTIRAA